MLPGLLSDNKSALTLDKWALAERIGSHIKLFSNGFIGSGGNVFNPSNAEATFIIGTRMRRPLKTPKPCWVGIHWIALTEYSQMSTQGFRHFQLFCTTLYCKISNQQHKG